MKTQFVIAVGGAVLGALLTAICLLPDGAERALAQEPPPFQGSAGPRLGPPVLSSAAGSALGSYEWTPEERVNIEVYERANRGVVYITTRTVVQDLFFETPREGSGSGSVLDRQGHILTNNHVVEDARKITVTLFDGGEYEARLVGTDPLNDVAVLRIDAPPDALYPIAIGDSNRLRVGQRVFAIGNPFGLERTMTVGIISSLNRTLPARKTRKMKSIIQIDAALNQGNSGGPLLDSRALLIGMNTAIASSTGENTGVGFAIPANTISRIVPQLIQNGRVVRPDIGIAYMVYTNQGLVIVATTPGGPADRAGLRGWRVERRTVRRGLFSYEENRIDRSQADVVVSVDNAPVKTVDDFLTAIESKRPGDEILLGVRRDGQVIAVSVMLESAE